MRQQLADYLVREKVREVWEGLLAGASIKHGHVVVGRVWGDALPYQAGLMPISVRRQWADYFDKVGAGNRRVALANTACRFYGVGQAGRDNVMAGADCGFSIHVGSGSVDRSVVWAKMAALAEGAKIASAQFWP